MAPEVVAILQGRSIARDHDAVDEGEVKIQHERQLASTAQTRALTDMHGGCFLLRQLQQVAVTHRQTRDKFVAGPAAAAAAAAGQIAMKTLLSTRHTHVVEDGGM
jgi:hypothetical protein